MKKMSVFVYRKELVIYLRTVGVTSVLAHCTVIHSETTHGRTQEQNNSRAKRHWTVLELAIIRHFDTGFYFFHSTAVTIIVKQLAVTSPLPFPSFSITSFSEISKRSKKIKQTKRYVNICSDHL